MTTCSTERVPRQIAERERDFSPSSRESLESALCYDPTVPLAQIMLANVLEKEELAKEDGQRDAMVLARAAHWRRYDLDRLPKDNSKLWAAGGGGTGRANTALSVAGGLRQGLSSRRE